MHVTIDLKRKNTKWVDKLKKIMGAQGQKEVAVGFPTGPGGVGNAAYPNGASIVDVAIYNNFGTSAIPRRPFMENASGELQKMWEQLCKEAQPRINAGEISEETVMKAAALKGEAIIRTSIDDTNEPPNAPATIKMKKSSKPLIDTGEMRKHVKGVVRGKTT